MAAPLRPRLAALLAEPEDGEADLAMAPEQAAAVLAQFLGGGGSTEHLRDVRAASLSAYALAMRHLRAAVSREDFEAALARDVGMLPGAAATETPRETGLFAAASPETPPRAGRTCPVCSGPGRDVPDQRCKACYNTLFLASRRIVQRKVTDSRPIQLTHDLNQDLVAFAEDVKKMGKRCSNVTTPYSCPREAYRFDTPSKRRCTRCRLLACIRTFPELAHEMLENAVNEALNRAQATVKLCQEKARASPAPKASPRKRACRRVALAEDESPSSNGQLFESPGASDNDDALLAIVGSGSAAASGHPAELMPSLARPGAPSFPLLAFSRGTAEHLSPSASSADFSGLFLRSAEFPRAAS